MTLINGYELFALPCAFENWQNGIAFTKFRNDLGEGTGASVLFGANAGNQDFNFGLKLKDFSDSKTVEYNGRLFTPAEYIWDLYCRTERTGTPFVMQNLRNSQYYLVEFAETKLTLERVHQKYYSTGIALRQVRRLGVSVFDVSKLSGVWGWYRADTLGLSNGQSLVGWVNSMPDGAHALSTANLTYSTPAQNGRGAVVFNGTNGYAAAAGTPPIKQIIVALKINTATFANYGGLVTNNAVIGGADAGLVGSNGTAKFENFSRGSAYAYYKNGIAFTESNQQAPMQEFGVVSARYSPGFNINYLVIGSDRLQTGRYLNATIGEIVLGDISDTDAQELIEHLVIKWND